MKRTLFLLLLAIAIGFMGCNRNSKPQPTPQPAAVDLAGADVVILHEGQLQFYNHAAQTLTPFEAEKDSVINLAFDDNNHLFYTTAKGQDLVLKTIDLSESDPQPKLCADWQLTLDQVTDNLFGTGAYGLEMDDSMENLYLFCNQFDGDDHFNYEVCNIASGETKGIDYEEHRLVCFPIAFLDHFYNEDRQFYYASPSGKVCLSDRIDFTKVLEVASDLKDMDFSPVAVSPDGAWIVYAADVHIGEGWSYYCVASADGKIQKALTDSDVWTPAPQWLPDGSLVYVGKEPAVKIDAPDGTTTTILDGAKKFYLKPVGKTGNPFQEKQVDLANCDMAIIEDGKVTFCNPAHNIYIPLATEEDEVLNGVFHGEDYFYYTVVIGGELYLKYFYKGEWGLNQRMLTDWGLKRSDCSSEDGDLVSLMGCKGEVPVVSIGYNLFDEYAEFTDFRTYNPRNQKKRDNYFVVEEGEVPLTEDDLTNDQDLFVRVEEEIELDEDEDGEGYKAYYYYVQNGDSICLSDKIDFDRYKTEYSYEPQFVFLGFGPGRNCVLFAAPIDWGHTGHGPLCFASLDGKVQLVLDSDFQEACFGWLSDGRLAHTGADGIYVVGPNGKEEKISSAKRFVTAY